MILTAHQPVYLPWLGLFHKIALADQFCVFDCVQYQTKDFNNRNKIKTQSGPIWLSVPVESKNHLDKKIIDIKIIENGWNKKHFKSIDLAYRKSKFYELYIDKIYDLLITRKYKYLVDLNFDFLKFGLDELKIETKICWAHEFSFEGVKSDLVLDMCKTLKADNYIFGFQGRDYADINSFRALNVEPHFQDYIHPMYRQLHGDFMPYMSFLDLLFNEGMNSHDILMSGNIKKEDI